MTLNDRLHSDRPAASLNGPRALAARAVQARSVATIDALYAYAVTGSAFATLMALAAPHFFVLSFVASSTGRDKAGSF